MNATILAAGRFGVCTEAEAKELSKRWTKYRKAKHLDHYGKKEGITNNYYEDFGTSILALSLTLNVEP